MRGNLQRCWPQLLDQSHLNMILLFFPGGSGGLFVVVDCLRCNRGFVFLSLMREGKLPKSPLCRDTVGNCVLPECKKLTLFLIKCGSIIKDVHKMMLFFFVFVPRQLDWLELSQKPEKEWKGERKWEREKTKKIVTTQQVFILHPKTINCHRWKYGTGQ